MIQTASPPASSPHAATFAEYFRNSDDPWGYRTRWYERRKRDILLASLPREHFASAWEIGCANGELTALLASRCDRLIATDGDSRAVALARRKTCGLPHVRVEQKWHPADWLEGRFDLLVFSELGYYLEPAALAETARRLRGSLAPDGVLVACHWREPIAGCALTGDGVHEVLRDTLPFPVAVSHREDDFILELWTHDDARSVARREGLR